MLPWKDLSTNHELDLLPGSREYSALEWRKDGGFLFFSEMYTLPPISMVLWKIGVSPNSRLSSTAIFPLNPGYGRVGKTSLVYITHTCTRYVNLYCRIFNIYKYIRLPLSVSMHTCVYDKHIDTSRIDSTGSCCSFFILPTNTGIRGPRGACWDAPSIDWEEDSFFGARPHLVTWLVWPLWWSNNFEP